MKYAVCLLRTIVLPVFILILMSSSCTTTAADTAAEQRVNWTYEVEITLPGTKSEGRWGHLYYKGKQIPAVFELMAVDDTLYVYRLRQYAWSFGGYEKQEKTESKIAGSAEKMTSAEREKGWYRASRDRRKAGTPSAWIWIKRDKLEAFLDPDKMDAFIEEHNIRPIDSMIMFER